MTDHKPTRKTMRQRERRSRADISNSLNAISCAYNRDSAALLAAEPGEGAFMGLPQPRRAEGPSRAKKWGAGMRRYDPMRADARSIEEKAYGLIHAMTDAEAERLLSMLKAHEAAHPQSRCAMFIGRDGE